MKRILVADDEVRFCEVLRELLTEAGYEVVVAYDGLAVLERLREPGIDLLIVDIAMPRLGGASLVQMLRTDPAWQHVARLPIIVISALWDVFTFDLDVQAGFAKPIQQAVVEAKVHELIGPP